MRRNNLWCYIVSTNILPCISVLNVPTYFADVLALALAHNAALVHWSKQRPESAPLNKNDFWANRLANQNNEVCTLGKKGQMPNGLSWFPFDFNMALWTAARGKLLPRSEHKI